MRNIIVTLLYFCLNFLYKIKTIEGINSNGFNITLTNCVMVSFYLDVVSFLIWCKLLALAYQLLLIVGWKSVTNMWKIETCWVCLVGLWFLENLLLVVGYGKATVSCGLREILKPFGEVAVAFWKCLRVDMIPHVIHSSPNSIITLSHSWADPTCQHLLLPPAAFPGGREWHAPPVATGESAFARWSPRAEP